MGGLMASAIEPLVSESAAEIEEIDRKPIIGEPIDSELQELELSLEEKQELIEKVEEKEKQLDELDLHLANPGLTDRERRFMKEDCFEILVDIDTLKIQAPELFDPEKAEMQRNMISTIMREYRSEDEIEDEDDEESVGIKGRDVAYPFLLTLCFGLPTTAGVMISVLASSGLPMALFVPIAVIFSSIIIAWYEEGR